MSSASETHLIQAGISDTISNRLREAIAALNALERGGDGENEGMENVVMSDGVPIAAIVREDTEVVLIDKLSGEEKDTGDQVFNWLEGYLKNKPQLRAEVIERNLQGPFGATEIIEAKLRERGIQQEILQELMSFLRDNGAKWTDFIKKLQAQ